MTTSLNQSDDDNGSYSPTFEKKIIEENRQDGYWIEAFQVDDQSRIGYRRANARGNAGFGFGHSQARKNDGAFDHSRH